MSPVQLLDVPHAMHPCNDATMRCAHTMTMCTACRHAAHVSQLHQCSAPLMHCLAGSAHATANWALAGSLGGRPWQPARAERAGNPPCRQGRGRETLPFDETRWTCSHQGSFFLQGASKLPRLLRRRAHTCGSPHARQVSMPARAQPALVGICRWGRMREAGILPSNTAGTRLQVKQNTVHTNTCRARRAEARPIPTHVRAAQCRVGQWSSSPHHFLQHGATSTAICWCHLPPAGGSAGGSGAGSREHDDQ
eukprot:361496-Chlamydomonas_euryale.AAC.1